LILIWHRMNHSVKRRHQALHQTHHHYYLNISVEVANLSDWRIESKKSIRYWESNRIETFFYPNWNALVDTDVGYGWSSTSGGWWYIQRNLHSLASCLSVLLLRSRMNYTASVIAVCIIVVCRHLVAVLLIGFWDALLHKLFSGMM